jgi:hypothetical protein
MARIKTRRRAPQWIWRLTMLAFTLDFFATLSYATGAHTAVRYFSPPFGAWWSQNEFAFLECASTALGMLVGIRLGAWLVAGDALRVRATIASVIAGAIAMPPLARLGAEISRYRFTSGALVHGLLIDRFGYDAGMLLDKILTAGVYSMKISAFAFPVGMILFALAIAFFMTIEPVEGAVQEVSR